MKHRRVLYCLAALAGVCLHCSVAAQLWREREQTLDATDGVCDMLTLRDNVEAEQGIPAAAMTPDNAA